MKEIEPSDTDVTNGKTYEYQREISFAGDGIISYKFYFEDDYGLAKGTPTKDSTINISPEPLLFPNPTNGEFTISFIPEDVDRIIIYRSNGIKISEYEKGSKNWPLVDSTSNTLKINVDEPTECDEIPPGEYYIIFNGHNFAPITKVFHLYK